nr:MAG TPA: membrane glycoprotein [Caudoviricetes sp.]
MILTFFSADKYGIKSDMFASIQREWATLEKVFKAYTASLNGAKFSISDFNTALAQSKAKAEQEGEAVEGLTLKMVALRTGAMLLNIALNAIVSTVANFVITKFNEWRTAIETNAQKSKELSSSMTDLISQYKELGDRSGWDTDDFAQAKDLNAEILNLLKNQSAEMDEKLRKLDLENGKYQEQIDLLNELSISTLTQNKADQGKLLEQTAKGKSSGQYVIGDSSDTDMANALGGKFGGSLDSNTGVFNFGGFDPNDADSILAYYDKLSSALDYLGSNYDSATLEASSLYNQMKSEKNAIEDQANAYRSSSDTLKEVIAAQKLSSTSSKRSEEDIKAVTDALEGLKGAYGGITSGNLVSFLSGDKKLGGTYADALNQLKDVMLNLGFEDNTSDAQAFVDVLVQLGIVSSSSASKVDGLSESASAAADQLKEATDGLDKIQSAYSTLSDVIDEYNKNGYLTVSTLTDLINLGPEYYDCLVDESGQLAINTENINTMADAYYEMAKAALYAQAIESLNANTNTYANASKFLSQAQQEVKDMKSLLYTEGQRLIDEGGLSGNALATQVQAQQRIINTYSAMMDLLDKTHAQSAENQFRNPKDKNSKKSSGSDDKMTDAVSAWKTLSAAMEEYNQYGNLCISTLNDLLGLEDNYTSLLTEQNGKMSINTTEFKNLMFAQIAQANAADESGKSAAELKRILQYVDENVKGDTISFEQLTDAIEGYGTAMDKAKQKTDAIKSAFSSLSEVSKNKIDSPFSALDSDDVEKQYQAIRDLYDNTDLFTDDRFAGALNPETGLVDYNSDAFKQMFLEKLDGMATACEKTGGKAGKYLAQGFRDAEDKIKNNVISIEEYINGIGSTLENINNRMDNFQSAFNDLSDIVDEYNAYGDLSQDSIQKLMGLDVKYTACLELQGDKLVFNKEAFRALYVAQLQKLAADYEGTEIGKRYAEILQKVADGTWDVTDHMKGMGTEAQNLQTIFSNLKDLFSSLLDVFNKFNDNQSNDLKIYGDAMTEEIDKRIEALQDANDEQEKAIELAKLQAELEKAETQKTVRVYTSNGYEWQADESAIKEARDNLNSKQRENALNDEIDKLNKLKDKYTELINLIGSSYEDYQKKQEYAAKIQGMTFDQMTAGLDGYKDNVIANMKAIQGATNVNNVVTNLTNLVGTLVKLNDVLSSLSTGTTQSGGITGLFNRIKNMFSSFGNKSSSKGFLGRLSDAGKSILGIGDGSASSKLTADIAPVIKSGVGDGITTGLDAAKPSIAKSAQGIFSGNGGLKSIFQKGFSGVASIAQKAVGGLGSIFGNIGTTLGGTKLFSGIAGIFKGIGTTVSTVIGTAGGTGVAGTIAAAVSHIPVIGTILLGGTLAVGAIGGGSLTTGIKRIGAGITNVVKGIGSTISKAVKGVGSFISKLMPWNWGKSSSDSGSKKKGIGSWKIWPWNWGRAKGDKHIDQAAPYNVDEEGEEIIVRNPAKGRMTYLEKGDGVIPADTTENLMEIGKDPKKWLSEAMKESGNSVGSLFIDDLKNAKTKGDLISITKSLANNQMKRLRDKFDTVWKRLGKNAGLSEEQIDTIGNTIFDRMNSMISNSMDSALGNKNLTDDQIKTICAEMFQRMGSVYKNGWDNLYSLSPDMSTDASTAINKLFETIFADYNADTSNISDNLSNWLPKVENTMNTTPASGLSGGGGYYGNSMDTNIGPSASFSFSKVKKTIQGLFEKFSNSKLGTWLNKHSLGSTVDKLTKYNESNDPNMVQKALHLLTHPTELIASAVESAVKTGKKVTWAITHPKEAAQEVASVAKDAYSKGKEVASNVKDAVTHPKETAEKVVDKVKETYNNIKEAVSEKTNSAKNWVKDKVDKITGKKATGSRSINKSGTYNVDEKGQELIVRQPEAGRYTYLETGDGVVPADITSKLFDLGGNPDAWFQKQLAKNGGLTANVQNRSQAPSINIGDIYVQKPIGDVDGLAREIVQDLPNAIYQEYSKR